MKTPAPISALERTPYDLIREVSPDAIRFYVDELRGIYLPEDFKQAYADVLEVKFWTPQDRLKGKFGRFAVKLVESGGELPADGILAMGPVIGLSGLANDGRGMDRLRHSTLDEKAQAILKERGLPGADAILNRADYGSTAILLNSDGLVQAIALSSASLEFGRADTDGRRETCDMFKRLLRNEIEVMNIGPGPDGPERIIN
jgi:hypothetical protein